MVTVPAASATATRPAAATLSALRVLSALCVVIPVLVYCGVGLYLYQQMRTETEVRLDRALRIAHEHAAKVLDTNETVLARVLDAVGTRGMSALHASEKQLHEQLKSIARNKPEIHSIWINDAGGALVASSRLHPVPADMSFADRPYFRWHQVQLEGLYVSEPLVGKASGQSFFQLSRGLRRADGTFDGVVSVGLLPSYFQKFHSDLAADEPGLAINMVREDGAIISRWPVIAGAPVRLSPNSPLMTRIKAGQVSGNMHGVSSVDGRNRLILFQKVGDYPVYVGTGMDVAEIRKRWLEEMALLAAFGIPPLIGLFFAAQVALRRTRHSLQTAEQLHQETRARLRVEEALLQAQKLEALGRLTGGVAHDFNNALMVISNSVFLHKLKHPGEESAHLEAVGRAVGSATKLTRQLLAFSRRQALVPEYVQLQERLAAIEDLLMPVLGGQVQLKIDVAADTEPVLVDPAELELALINLAINARDAMPSGGRFEIRAGNATEVPPTLSGPMVLVEASDTGLGIAPDVLGKVFEPFFTTKPVGEGTGLGLSQVYGLCQRAGGLATIESKEGQGTTVRLFFPAAQNRRAPDRPDAAPSVRRRLDRRVLLVEDNDEVAAAVRPVLEAMGCTVTRMDRASEAKQWLQQQAELPDVVLSDVVMPGDMDGVALAQFLRAEYPRLPVLLMTGYAEQMEAISRLGFTILPKPCAPDVLADAIERAASSPRHFS